MKHFRILMISSGVFHPNLLARFWFERNLMRSGHFQFSRAASLEALAKLDMAEFAAIVLYVHHKTLSAAALERLDAYLGGGGGLLAVHSASASYKQSDAFAAILGGRFSAHGPVSSFSVRPITLGANPFRVREEFSIKDERYLHEVKAVDCVDFVSEGPDGMEPFVWRRAHGSGRICYCAAGHTAAGVRHPGVQQILVDGLLWAAGGLP